MQIRSSSGNGQILENVINKILVKNHIIAAAKVAKKLEGEAGVEAVIAGGLINSLENEVGLEDSDIDFIIAKVYEGNKLERTAQMGSALRGLGKGLGNLWQGVSNVGKGVVDKAKAVGKGIANLPQAMEQKGYQMEQKKYQEQIGQAQGIAKSLSQQYGYLQKNLANIGQAATALQSGSPDPATMNAVQGNIKAMMQHLQQMNQNIATLMKLKGALGPAPVAPVTPQQAVNRALPKAPAVQQTLPY